MISGAKIQRNKIRRPWVMRMFKELSHSGNKRRFYLRALRLTHSLPPNVRLFVITLYSICIYTML